jgi:hypothetical protein
MGPKTTSTSNGATPVGNDFNAWLQSMLNGTQYNPGQGPMSPIGSTPLPNWNQAQGLAPYTGGYDAQGRPTGYGQSTGNNSTAGVQPFTGQPSTGGGWQGNAPQSATQFAQDWARQNFGGASNSPGVGGSGVTSGGFNLAVQNALNGQLLDPSGANRGIANGIANGPGMFGQNNTNQYASQNYDPATVSQLATNLLQGSGMADLSGIGKTAQSNFDVGQGSSQYTNVLNQLLGQGQQLAGQGGFGSAAAGQANIGPGIALGAATQFDMNNPYFAALKQQQERALQQATASNNARFGAQGAGAIGSGAQLANSNLQSAASADQTVALQQALQGLQQQDLAERGTAANVGLTSRGQDAQVGIANAGNSTQASIANLNAGIQSQGNNNQLLAQMLSSTGQARGQDFQDSQIRMQSGLEQALKNAGFTNDRNAQDLVAMIQNQGLGNVFQTNSAAQNSLNQQNNNLNSINTTQHQNDFNVLNAQNNAQYGQQAINSNNQAYQSNQQDWNTLLGLGQNTNNTANNNIQNIINQLFGSYNNANGIGNAQATNNQSTPWWQSGLVQAIPTVINTAGSIYNNRRR